MVKNAKLKEKEETLIEDLRRFIKPHTLQLEAIIELYRLNDLEIILDDEPWTNIGDEYIKEFSQEISNYTEQQVNQDSMGLNHEKCDTIKIKVTELYYYALGRLDGMIHDWLLCNRDTYESEPETTDDIEMNVRIDEMEKVREVLSQMGRGKYAPFDVFDEFIDDKGGLTDSHEIASHLQEYLTHHLNYERDEKIEEDVWIEATQTEVVEEAEVVEEEESQEIIHEVPTENAPKITIGMQEIDELAAELEMSAIHSSPPCNDTVMPNQAWGNINWAWFCPVVQVTNDDKLQNIGEQIAALHEGGFIKTKQDLLDSMLFVLFATQKINQEALQSIVSMFSELR